MEGKERKDHPPKRKAVGKLLTGVSKHHHHQEYIYLPTRPPMYLCIYLLCVSIYVSIYASIHVIIYVITSGLLLRLLPLRTDVESEACCQSNYLSTVASMSVVKSASGDCLRASDTCRGNRCGTNSSQCMVVPRHP